MSDIDPYELIEKILTEAPTFESDGKRYYIVDLDTQVEEGELLAYVNSILADPPDPDTASPSELVGATIDGKLMRWKPDTMLTWRIDRAGFPDDATADKAHELCTAAGGAWNAAAEEGGLALRFSEAGDTPSLFKITYQVFSQPGLYAVAFFPKDPPSKRVLRLGPPTFEADATFDPVGVLRHELGHVLGFRHEHIRLGSKQREGLVVGKIGAEDLTDYDSKSVMHYPILGAGTNDFQLTDFDKRGFVDLYTLPGDQVKEFSP